MSPAELVQAQADELAGGAATVEDTVMQRAEVTLRAYRRACQVAGGARRGRGGRGRKLAQWPPRLNTLGSSCLAAGAVIDFRRLISKHESANGQSASDFYSAWSQVSLETD